MARVTEMYELCLNPDYKPTGSFRCYANLEGIGDKEDVIIMQSTGLNDKNGKEMYEGDVLRGGKPGFYKRHTYIEWHNARWEIAGIDPENTEYPHNNYSPLSFYQSEKGGEDNPYEIVGNIYQDNHLLQ